MKALPPILNIFIIINIFSMILSNPSYEDYSIIFIDKFKIGSHSKEINLILNSIISHSILFTNSKRDYSEEIQKNRKSDVLIDKLNFKGEIIPSFPFTLKLDETKLNKKDVLNLNFEPKINEFTFSDLATKLSSDNYYSQAWICNLSHIVMGSNIGELSWNNTMETNGRVVFDTRTKYIYIPKEYMKYISTIWSINGEGCKTILDSENDEKYFQCNLTMEKNIYSMPSIYFIIGGYGYRLKAEDLFEKNEDKFTCLIRFINEEEDLWILGVPFLREYKILFDYNKTRVGFSGEDIMNYKEEYDKWVIESKEKKSKLLGEYSCESVIFIIGTIIGCCILCYAAFWLYRNWRRDSNKYYIHTDEQFNKQQNYS